ncbi:fdrA domain protein [Clostridium sp. MSJ-11]|uniref:FdrA domain protein n=1 Tax=Clostridium mobile TaxID=2841512 RepID=A0ABS6EF16_9CLOT|nr:fdrA domain protein [Clostridium mobile]MBU5483812.1 fdrA domain protein [Clostridium mobile]
MNKIKDLFKNKVKVINIGLEIFHEANKHQKLDCIHVEWKPAAGGDAKLLEVLEKLNRK